MYLQPELLDHPKFLCFKKRVGDLALEYLARLWAHCQNNQRGEFWAGADAEYVETVCRWAGSSGVLYSAFTEQVQRRAGWIVPEEGGLRIHDWNEANSKLMASWKNGSLGGKKRQVNHSLPMGNPTLNPGVLRLEREERVEEREGALPPPLAPEVPSLQETIDYGQGPSGIPSAYCEDYWHKKNIRRAWFIRGELMDWQYEIRTFWKKDRHTWRPATTWSAGKATETDSLRCELQLETDPVKIAALQKRLKDLSQ